MELRNEYALITGANRGIGRAISLLLAEKGFHVLLVARGEEELKQLADQITSRFGVEAYYLVQDLTLKGADEAVTSWATGKSPALSVLVNNAGFGLWGQFNRLDLESQLDMVRLNVDAVLGLTHRLLPVLASQRKAYILNVASTTAYQAVPTLSVYAATKAFLLSFSRGLRYELKDSPVSVSCVCPGPTATGFASRAGLDGFTELADRLNMQPEEVARLSVAGMLKGRAEIVPGFLNRLSTIAVGMLPKSLIEGIAGGLYRTEKK